MKHEPPNTPWLYDKRPAADIGRDFYHKNRDGQGSLVALPEKERALTDWDRLKEVLYQFGLRGHEHMTPDLFFEEHKFHELAHSIREGWKDAKNAPRASWCLEDRKKRDSQKPSQNPCEDDSMECASSQQRRRTARTICATHGYFWVDYQDGTEMPDCPECVARKDGLCRTVTTPTAHDFTDEEIEAVLAWKEELSLSTRQMSNCTGIPIMPDGQKLTRPLSSQRVAAIAQHLAETEEE